jgi:hypothetical protein
MIYGFTGSRQGMTSQQKEMFRDLLEQSEASKFDAFHHGCAVGCDVEAAEIAKRFQVFIVGHPGIDDHGIVRSNWTMFDDITVDPLPFLERNRVIVTDCQLLIACPATNEEVRRSGTWSTIRFARSAHRRLMIIYPDGTTGE